MAEPFKLCGAVFVFLMREDKIYLMRRINTGYRKGYFGLPSGHIEADEFATEAALRELKEETGLDIQSQYLEFAHAMYRRSDRTYADYFFICKKWQGEPVIAEPERCDIADWFALDNLPEKIPSEVTHVLQCWKQGIQFSELVTPGREGK